MACVYKYNMYMFKYIYIYTTYTKIIHLGLLDICTYPFEFVMAQILFRPLIVWKAILGSRLSLTPFFIEVDNGKW